MMALPIFQLGSNIWTGAWVRLNNELTIKNHTDNFYSNPIDFAEHVQWNCYHHAMLFWSALSQEVPRFAIDVTGSDCGQPDQPGGAGGGGVEGLPQRN